MRFIKLFLISIVVLFLVMTALSSLLPAHLRMSRAIDISASKEKVFTLINDTKTWDTWNQFISNTALTNKSFSSPSTGSGAYITSDQLKIRIDKSSIDSITTSWNQSNAKRFTGGYNILELRTGTITVQWYFDFTFKWYFWEKLSSLLYEKQLGPVMEESLTKLKETVESRGS
jgi:Polyketide cyclase / dehydrase and lipid transport